MVKLLFLLGLAINMRADAQFCRPSKPNIDYNSYGVVFDCTSNDQKYRLIQVQNAESEAGVDNPGYQTTAIALIPAAIQTDIRAFVNAPGHALLTQLVIDRAYWTKDSRYCVFSTYHANGHSPWHNPTFVLDALKNNLFDVEESAGTIVAPEFEVMDDKLLKVFVGLKNDTGIDFENPTAKNVGIEAVLAQKPIQTAAPEELHQIDVAAVSMDHHQLEDEKVYVLTQALDGIDGRLILLRDPALRRDSSGLVSLSPTGESLRDSKDSGYIPNATLEMQDASGNTRLILSLKAPWAELTKEPSLTGLARPTFSLMVDFSAGFGSYSGPTTSFFEVVNGQVKFYKVKVGDAPETKISLMSSIKNDWEPVARPGGGSDLLEVSCRPNMDDTHPDRFSITYKRYHFDGSKWALFSKEADGFWENEGEFPGRQLFP